ncbi:MAG: hypothetical protein LBE09_02685, partial [Christensenellaceae bacterium]|nr:hypothetical protein [Christensenellaceae bacterium]
MIKSFSAYTSECDDIDIAISEILGQIYPETNLCKYTAGLLSYYGGFEDDNFVAKLCERLPFDIVG